MTTIHVEASGKYDVLVEEGNLKKLGEYTTTSLGIKTAHGNEACENTERNCESKNIDKVGRKAVIISDDNVFPLYGKTAKVSLEEAGIDVLEYVFPAGEKSKTLKTYDEIQEFLCKNRVTRGDIIIALGGGVTGDLAGFVAATYLRGIKFIQVPTTLLAMVDSSVGGKTAVDLEHGKNQVGCFYQPVLVLCDPSCLATLPEEEYKCGCAEIIKYAILGNEELFKKLDEKPVSKQYEEIIAECVRMKRDVVEEDEFDTGKRQILNLGHSVGHAVETLSDFKTLHGQAVAIGTAVIARACAAKGICTEETKNKIIALLDKYGLPCEMPYNAKETAAIMLNDKKMNGNTMNLILPERIGLCKIEKVLADKLEEWLIAGGLK